MPGGVWSSGIEAYFGFFPARFVTKYLEDYVDSRV
jgi:dimethylaniline monooxygenase (N-oxide forming)